MSLSVAIMAVPERTAQVRALLGALAPWPEDVQPPVVIWDRAHRGPVHTARSAWSAASGSHHLVLQDDILVARDLLATCHSLVEVQPQRLISLYTARSIADTARMSGAHWVRLHRPLGALGYLMPRSWAFDFVRWERRMVMPDLDSYDVRICLWLRAREREAWATVPSLVEHADSGYSAMGHPHAPGGKPRVSRWFIGTRKSGLECDWSADTEPPLDHDKVGADYLRWLRHG